MKRTFFVSCHKWSHILSRRVLISERLELHPKSSNISANGKKMDLEQFWHIFCGSQNIVSLKYARAEFQKIEADDQMLKKMKKRGDRVSSHLTSVFIHSPRFWTSVLKSSRGGNRRWTRKHVEQTREFIFSSASTRLFKRAGKRWIF